MSEEVQSKELSQEEIDEHFTTADKLFEGKKFDDGAVVSDEDGIVRNEDGTVCDERNPAEGNDELPPPVLEQNEAGDMLPGRLPGKLPPTTKELMSNDMIWLIAKVCYEVNRVYCEKVTIDFLHPPWAIAEAEIRKSTYDGVCHVLKNPDVTPEEIHAAWMKNKLENGWTFGNLKDSEAKTHPSLMSFHQLHAHERAKDGIFLAICKTMFGK